jgi:hypothetical protein
MTLKLLWTAFFLTLAFLVFKLTGVIGLAFLVLVFGLFSTWLRRRSVRAGGG